MVCTTLKCVDFSNPACRMVFASGVDPLFISFEYIKVGEKMETGDEVGKEFTWRRSWGHKMHSHDVRSIEVADNLVLSGGVDRKIVVSRQKRREGETGKTSTVLHSFRTGGMNIRNFRENIENSSVRKNPVKF